MVPGVVVAGRAEVEVEEATEVAEERAVDEPVRPPQAPATSATARAQATKEIRGIQILRSRSTGLEDGTGRLY